MTSTTNLQQNGITATTAVATPTSVPTQVVTQAQGISLPLLKIGTAGEAVRFLQQRLIDFGYRICFNGQFGPQIDEAVRHFQSSLGLTVDGLVGYYTWLALCEDYPYLGRSFHYPCKHTQYPYDIHMPELHQGDDGHAVECLQLRLYANGIYIFVDGIFGPNTERAVKQFQRCEGLAVDGIVGRNTWRKLG